MGCLPNCDKLHESYDQMLGKLCINHFANLTNEEKLIFLFSNENPEICCVLAKTIHKRFQAREKIFSSLDLYFRYMLVMYNQIVCGIIIPHVKILYFDWLFPPPKSDIIQDDVNCLISLS